MSKDTNYIRLIRTAQWRRLRNKILGEHPFCADCAEKHVYRFATEVHHVRPVEAVKDIEAMRQRMFDPSNLRPLCHSCHVEAHRLLGKCTKEENKRRKGAEVEAFFRAFSGNDQTANEC